MRIVVTGATGTVGGAVLRRLLADGHHAVAATRDTAVALPDGAQAVRFDFGDPATHRAALAGADGLFLMRPPSLGADAVNPVVDAAVAEGVGRVAFLSVLGAGRNPVVPHRATERHLEAAPVAAGLLRAAYFMQNLSEVHAREVRGGQLCVPAGAGATSMVDARDVADVAAVWLTSAAAGGALRPDGPRGDRHVRGRPGPVRGAGHRVDYRRPGAVAFVRHRLAAGDDAAFAAVMAGIYTATRLGLADRVTDTVAHVLGHPPRSFGQFAEDYREAWT